MTQQQRYDAGTIQPMPLLALRNKLTGENVKIRFTISAGNLNYETNQYGNWNLGQHLQSLQSQQGESVEVQLHLTPDNWDELGRTWDRDEISLWGENVPESQIPEEMYRPVTITVNMQNNNLQDISTSDSRNLAVLNPNRDSRPDQISREAWNAALRGVRNPIILVLLQPIWIKARKFSNRPESIQSPTLIVVHHTGGPVISGAIHHFTGENASSSAHYIIDRDGQIVKMVKNSKCAWHADGRSGSHWGGSNRVNQFSIGIEIVHEDGSDGNNPFTEEQYKALIDLIQKLQKRYNIPQHRVVGHSDVQIPPDHNCPGPNFDWKRLEDEGLGLKIDTPENWLSNLNPYDFPIRGGSSGQLIDELKGDLRSIGYCLPLESGYGPETATTVERFKRHFLAGSRRPRNERWHNTINGNRISFEIAEMIRAVRDYVRIQEGQ